MMPNTKRFGWFTGALITVLAVGACNDATRPERPESVSFNTTMETKLLNPKTHQLEVVRLPPTAPGVMADIAPPTSQTLPGILVPFYSLSLAKGASKQQFTKINPQNGHTITFTRFWDDGGGPVASMYAVEDGHIILRTTFTWGKTNTAYYASSMVTTSYAKSTGATVGTSMAVAQTTVISKPCNPRVNTCPPAQMVKMTPEDKHLIARVMYALAMRTSSPAQAEIGFSPGCTIEWIAYLGAVATAASAFEAPVVGIYAAIGLEAAITATMWYLEQCLESGVTAPSPLFPGGSGGGGSAGGGSGSGSGSGGGSGVYLCIRGTDYCLLLYVL
ncbi:MAG: hypothetical protein M3Y05_01800 [Gemmatimonadota bacterium]|nr:hypothetical protein [Gemmatimonadota bacterium]